MICFRVSIASTISSSLQNECPFFGGVRHKHAATGLLVGGESVSKAGGRRYWNLKFLVVENEGTGCT
jgi:hypothetical protein